eukprot:IDg6809t1
MSGAVGEDGALQEGTPCSPVPTADPRSPFLIPDLKPLLEADTIIIDAFRALIFDEPPVTALSTTAEDLTIEFIEQASTTFLLLRAKPALAKNSYTAPSEDKGSLARKFCWHNDKYGAPAT